MGNIEGWVGWAEKCFKNTQKYKIGCIPHLMHVKSFEDSIYKQTQINTKINPYG